MSTISNSASDCTLISTGLPDESHAQFIEECNAFDDERRAKEAGNESDYFEQLAQLNRQNEEIGQLTSLANELQNSFHEGFMAHAAKMKKIHERITAALA